MNRLLYIALYSSLLLAFTACTSDNAVQENKYTVGEADNEIRFSAGVTTGGQSAQSRAGEPLADHYAMKANTQIRLKVDGTWTGHLPVTISQTTECTTKADAQNDGTSEYASTAADNINSLGSFNPTLYWDDYGTGDPANKETGRKDGLNVFGVAIDGETTAPAMSGSDPWTSLSWEVNTDGSDVLKKDIICSNNLSKDQAPGRYTFANRNNDVNRRLDFKHVLSKITLYVTAGTGFNGSIGSTTNKFVSEPEVHLTNDGTWNNTYSGHTSNYCLTSGTVNIKTASASATSTVKGAVKMEKTTDVTGVTRVYHALVFPGSKLGEADEKVIALLKADGNIYKIKAKEIKAAMETAHSGAADKTITQAGYNYIIKVKVNKQGLNVTATVTDWNTVETEADAIIDINNANYGNVSSDFLEQGFDLYIKEKDATAYATHGVVTHTENSGTHTYSTDLYWPTTTKEYHLRAFVDPVTNQPSLISGDTYKTFSGSDYKVESLKRGNDYLWGSTWNGSVEGEAIDPTSGKVALRFKHLMSQVTVIVKTTETADAVNLAGSKCVITGLNNEATANFDNGTVTPLTGAEKTSNYTVYDFQTDVGKHTQSPVAGGYPSIQVPQAAFTGDGIKFVITLLDGTTYQLPLSDSVLTTGDNAITKWEQGGSYKYILTLKKQEIKVTAQLTEWNTLQTAGGDIQL